MTGGNPACLGCGAPLPRTLADLGCTPLANAFVPSDRTAPDPVYPLHESASSSSSTRRTCQCCPPTRPWIRR